MSLLHLSKLSDLSEMVHGYFINNEKKVWSNAKGGHFMRLYNMRGRRNKYNIKNVWYTPDELFNMTFNK